MNQQLIRDQLTVWLQTFVEQPHPSLGGWPPCPYARQARLNNKIEVQFADVDKLKEAVNNATHLLENKDVVVICFDHTAITPVQLQDRVNDINADIMPCNYVVLEDHPDNLEFVHGVNMNFGHCGLLLLSKLNVLNEASEKIRSKGYYDTWSPEELDYVVNWRFK